MQRNKRIVIVAGEESGDMHAASFVRKLKARDPQLEIAGIGGHHMQQAGVELISDLARYGVTGISEVLRHFSEIKKAFQAIKDYLTLNKPDLLILVDYPGFNLRLAKFAKKTLGLRVLYYISPQIWAWKAGRIHGIRQYVDHMAVILPFEKKLYQNAGVPVSFVGHPFVSDVMDNRSTPARSELGLPHDKRVIALLPGSRLNEVDRHMPVLVKTAINLNHQFDDLHFVIPIASSVKTDHLQAYLRDSQVPYTLLEQKAWEAMYCSDFVIVASGTASLECALLEKPMCIIYKSSMLTYLAATLFIKVKYLGLCNILQNKMIVPELLQYDCSAKELTNLMVRFLLSANFSRKVKNNLRQLKDSLSLECADCAIEDLIQQYT